MFVKRTFFLLFPQISLVLAPTNMQISACFTLICLFNSSLLAKFTPHLYPTFDFQQKVYFSLSLQAKQFSSGWQFFLNGSLIFRKSITFVPLFSTNLTLSSSPTLFSCSVCFIRFSSSLFGVGSTKITVLNLQSFPLNQDVFFNSLDFFLRSFWKDLGR